MDRSKSATGMGGGRRGSIQTAMHDETRLSTFPINSFIVKHEEHQQQASSPLPVKFRLGDPIHDESTELGRLRNRVGKLFNSTPLQIFFTFMIIFNAVLLGLITFDFVQQDPELKKVLNYLDLATLCVFTVEFTFQFFYLGPVFIRYTWLVFDLVVVIFSWSFYGSGLAVLRAFRIFRIFGFLRKGLASKWTAMQELFIAIGKTLPFMSNVAAILGMLFYAFCVLTTNLYGDLYDEGYFFEDYFGRLDYSFITLFQMLTTDSWVVIVRQVMVPRYFSYNLFFCWVSISTIIVLNLIVAIICDALIMVKQKQKDSEVAQAGKAFATTVPIEDLIRQQAELMRIQSEMERAVDFLMLRFPAQVGLRESIVL